MQHLPRRTKDCHREGEAAILRPLLLLPLHFQLEQTVQSLSSVQRAGRAFLCPPAFLIAQFRVISRIDPSGSSEKIFLKSLLEVVSSVSSSADIFQTSADDEIDPEMQSSPFESSFVDQNVNTYDLEDPFIDDSGCTPIKKRKNVWILWPACVFTTQRPPLSPLQRQAARPRSARSETLQEQEELIFDSPSPPSLRRQAARPRSSPTPACWSETWQEQEELIFDSPPPASSPSLPLPQIQDLPAPQHLLLAPSNPPLWANHSRGQKRCKDRFAAIPASPSAETPAPPAPAPAPARIPHSTVATASQSPLPALHYDSGWISFVPKHK